MISKSRVGGNNIIEIIRISFNSTSSYSFLILLQKVIEGFFPSVQILITAYLVDTAIAILDGGADYNRIYMPIVLMLISVGYRWYSQQMLKFSICKLSQKLSENINVFMLKKISKIKYKFIENKKESELIYRVLKQTDIEIREIYLNILNLLVLMLRILGIVIIISSKIWWAGLLILGLNIPLILLSIKSGKAVYAANVEAEQSNKISDYLSDILRSREAVAERTVFNYGEWVNEKWIAQYEKARKLNLKAFLKYFLKRKWISIQMVLISLIMIVVLGINTIKGSMTIGLFMSITGGILAFANTGAFQLTMVINDLTKRIEFVKDFKEILNLEEEKGAVEVANKNFEKIESIEFRNVTFKYPGSDISVLQDISFKMEEGKKYAFVGENGVGKTTIVKLLTGLYREYTGQILVNGRELRQYSLADIKSMCSVVYQDYAKYFVSFKENIMFGRNNTYIKYNKSNYAELKELGVCEFVEKLPEGEETILGKVVEKGIDISLGEWQQIAIARSIVNPAPLKILDEPTASIDPMIESKIYKTYKEISQNKMTIFITHRMGSARLADTIIVFDKGRVSEIGTHEELIEAKGAYWDMYNKQRSWYI